MIKLDYVIERDEGDRIRTYMPMELPRHFDSNVLYIKAPNATGKSTILNLIALGLFGHKLTNEEIDPALRKRIVELLKSDHQRVKFDLQITNPHMGITINSCKPNQNLTDISVVKTMGDNTVQLSSDSFFREFRLVYDVPQKPLERIPQLILEIQTKQNGIGNKLGLLKDYLRQLIEEIKNSKDPKVLLEFENKRNKLISEQESVERELIGTINIHRKLTNYMLTKEFVDIFIRIKNFNDQLEKVENAINKAQRDGIRIVRKQKNISNQITESINVCKNCQYITRGPLERLLPPNEKDRFILWDQSLIDNEVNYPDTYKTLRQQNKYFIELLQESLNREKRETKEESEKFEVFERLIAILSDNRFSNITLPGLNQTVREFVLVLSTELENYHENNKFDKDIKSCIENLKKFNSGLDETIKLIRDFHETEDQETDRDSIDIQSKIKEKEYLEKNLKRCEINKNEIRDRLIANEIDPGKALEIYQQLKTDKDISLYHILSDAHILNEIEGNVKTIAKYKKKLIDIQTTLALINNTINTMNEKETHKYYQHLESLELLFQYSQQLEQLFKNQFALFSKHSIDFSSNTYQYTNITEQEKRYLESLEKYLAVKIGHIKHIDEDYKLIRLNLYKQSFIVENSKKEIGEIYFSDISTGQSQSMYLRSKLNLSDDKKIIALFDEVATMDETSLAPIKDKLRELYYENKLLLAIIVQKGEKVEIKSLI